jgi:hypothetical protein
MRRESYGFGSCLPAERAPGCHMSSGSGTRLPDRKGSDTVTCIVALDPLGGLRCAVSPTTLDPGFM